MQNEAVIARELIVEKCQTNRLDVSNISFLVKQFLENLVVIGGTVSHFQPFERLDKNYESFWILQRFHNNLPTAPKGYQLQVRWMPFYTIDDSTGIASQTAYMCFEDDLGTCWQPMLVASSQNYPKVWDFDTHSWVNFRIDEKFSAQDGKYSYTHAGFIRLLKIWFPW